MRTLLAAQGLGLALSVFRPEAASLPAWLGGPALEAGFQTTTILWILWPALALSRLMLHAGMVGALQDAAVSAVGDAWPAASARSCGAPSCPVSPCCWPPVHWWPLPSTPNRR